MYLAWGHMSACTVRKYIKTIVMGRASRNARHCELAHELVEVFSATSGHRCDDPLQLAEVPPSYSFMA